MVVIPRIAHRVWAYLGGYFWTPCPLCGREFGGHEWRDRNDFSSSIRTGTPSSSIRTGMPVVGQAICPRCTILGRGHPR